MSSAQDPTPSSGLRLGPVTWVPGWRATPNDPWAHRKGEPRPLALLWSLYLMASAVLTLLRVRSLTMPTTQQFEFGCRSMVLMSLIGVAILWPMVRLSQRAPARVGRALAADLVVLLAPVQAVVWPMGLLTHWPIEVIAALVAALASWALLATGMLAWALGGEGASRWGWMVLVTLASVAAPGVLAFWPAPMDANVRSGLMSLSPLTAAWSLTGAPSGLVPLMQPREWVLLALPGMLGSLMWLASIRLTPLDPAGYSVVGPGPQD